ncbi:hypothetical protein EZS27_015121 [termite gut metagenome]|uniref:Uncharacterized protein n=1 Tax=termite gut metagenome TaxID=433724 RepID=A0A5J4RSL7_9ZZZZ
MKINEEILTKAQEKIKDMFLEQVEKGKQSKNNKDGIFACGQFLNFLESNQRGLHGTAASLRVISHYAPINNDTLNSLLKYAEFFVEIEGNGDSYNKNTAQIDSNNVIKKSELLYALSFIKDGTADCSPLIKRLANELLKCKIEEESWPFFSNFNSDVPDIIPTAIAVLALHANKYPSLDKCQKYLLKEIKGHIKKIKDPETFSKIVLALYVLVYTEFQPTLSNKKKEYSSILKEIWASDFAFMKNDMEQNIEYPYNTRHFYVRIPWQLYLLAISNKLSIKYSSKVSYFARLNSALKQANNEGFKYLQSGKNISSRTNAILFDVLEHIKEEREKSLLIYVLNYYDKFINFLQKKYVKKFFNVVGLCLIIYSFYLWKINDTSLITQSAPSFMASFIVYLFLYNIKSPK